MCFSPSTVIVGAAWKTRLEFRVSRFNPISCMIDLLGGDEPDIMYAAVDHGGATQAPIAERNEADDDGGTRTRTMTLDTDLGGFGSKPVQVAPWLHDMTRKEAEAKLKAEGMQDGLYLVRPRGEGGDSHVRHLDAAVFLEYLPTSPPLFFYEVVSVPRLYSSIRTS